MQCSPSKTSKTSIPTTCPTKSPSDKTIAIVICRLLRLISHHLCPFPSNQELRQHGQLFVPSDFWVNSETSIFLRPPFNTRPLTPLEHVMDSATKPYGPTIQKSVLSSSTTHSMSTLAVPYRRTCHASLFWNTCWHDARRIILLYLKM